MTYFAALEAWGEEAKNIPDKEGKLACWVKHAVRVRNKEYADVISFTEDVEREVFGANRS